MQTQEIAATKLKHGRSSYRYFIPLVEPIWFQEESISIPPYLMGALLGDGSFTKYLRFANSDKKKDIIDRLRTELPADMEMVKYLGDDRHWYIRNKISRGPNHVLKELERLGLKGKGSTTKFIPKSYLFGSVSTRETVLQGLLDTDGSAKENGNITYCTVSRQLADNVAFLARSLGGYTQVNTDKPRRGNNGTFTLNIAFPDRLTPFHMARKKQRYDNRKNNKHRHRNIVSIEPNGETDMTCLAVEAANGLFVIDDCIVTHNTGMGKTTFVMQSLIHAATRGEVILNYSAELSTEEYANLVTAHVLRKNRNHLTVEDRKQAAQMLGGIKFYIGRNPDLTTIGPVLDLMEAGIRRLGVTVAVLDHLHFLVRHESDTVKAQENAMQRLKNLAVKYGCKIIVVGQPRKANAQSRGKLVSISDAKGSETFTSDADVALALHRDVAKVLDPKNPPREPYDSKCQVHLLKGRSQGTGNAYAELLFLGEIATFSEISLAEPPTEFQYGK